MPKPMSKFIVFSRADFVGFWCVSGCISAPMFDVFRGSQRWIAENLESRYVYSSIKFVDSIEKLADFQEN